MFCERRSRAKDKPPPPPLPRPPTHFLTPPYLERKDKDSAHACPEAVERCKDAWIKVICDACEKRLDVGVDGKKCLLPLCHALKLDTLKCSLEHCVEDTIHEKLDIMEVLFIQCHFMDQLCSFS